MTSRSRQSSPVRNLRRDLLVLSTVVGAGLLPVLFIFLLLRGNERKVVQEEFTTHARRRVASVTSSIKHDVEVLLSVRAFFDASTAVDRDEFAIYATRLLEANEGLVALEWVSRTPRDSVHNWKVPS